MNLRKCVADLAKRLELRAGKRVIARGTDVPRLSGKGGSGEKQQQRVKQDSGGHAAHVRKKNHTTKLRVLLPQGRRDTPCTRSVAPYHSPKKALLRLQRNGPPLSAVSENHIRFRDRDDLDAVDP